CLLWPGSLENQATEGSTRWLGPCCGVADSLTTQEQLSSHNHGSQHRRNHAFLSPCHCAPGTTTEASLIDPVRTGAVFEHYRAPEQEASCFPTCVCVGKRPWHCL